MKKALIILLLTAATLRAQTPSTGSNDTVDTNLRDEILRRAVRDFGRTNGAPAPGLAAANTNLPAPTVMTVPDSVLTNNAMVPAPAMPTPVVAAPAVPIPAAAVVPNLPAAATNVTPAVAMPTPAPTPVPGPGRAGGPRPFPRTGAGPAGLAGGIPSIPGPGAPGPAVVAPGIAAAGKVDEAADQVADMPSIDLLTFLGVYAELTGRTVLHASTLPLTPISLKTQKPLTRTQMKEAMETVLGMNNIGLVDVGDNFVKAVPAQTLGLEPAPFRTNDSTGLPEADIYVNQIVQLKYAKPSEVAPVIQPYAKLPGNIFPIDSSQVLIIRDYAANVKRMMELINKVDVVYQPEFVNEVIPIMYAQAADIASALASLGGSTVGSIGRSGSSGGLNRGSTGSSLGGFTPGGAGGAPGGLGATGAPNPLGGGLAGSRGSQATSFADRLRSLQGGGRGAAGGSDFQILGTTKIIPDERSNSLLVFASKQDMEMIKDIVKKLDVVLAQVLIEAIIMEVNLDNSVKYGVSSVQNSPSAPGHYFTGIGGVNNGTFLNPQSFSTIGTNGLNSLPSGFSYLANFGNDFQATVTAIQTDSRIRVLSTPSIQTSHGVQASIKVGNTIPYVTGTYFGGINGQASSQYTQQFVGIDLEVRPLINTAGVVEMEITQDIQQLGPSTTIDGNAVPTTTQRSAASTVSVRDRDTIVLGGFISTTKSKTRGGVPVLMDIPLLGNLFRSTDNEDQRVELIVLIRPTVLPTPEAAALVATHQQHMLPEVLRAEQEEKSDAKQRMRELDKSNNLNDR